MKLKNFFEFSEIVIRAIEIIEKSRTPFFRTGVIAKRIVRETYDVRLHYMLEPFLNTMSRYVGNLMKALELKGFMEKYSRRVWKRIFRLSLENGYCRNEILWIANGLRQVKNQPDLLPFIVHPIVSEQS